MKAEIVKFIEGFCVDIVDEKMDLRFSITTIGRLTDVKAVELADKINSALASHVQSELSKTNAGYWKARCEAAESVIISGSQVETKQFKKWIELREQPEPPSELSAKIAEIEKTFSDERIKEWSSDEACEADGGENKRLAFFISVGANKLRSEILKLLKGE